ARLAAPRHRRLRAAALRAPRPDLPRARAGLRRALGAARQGPGPPRHAEPPPQDRRMAAGRPGRLRLPPVPRSELAGRPARLRDDRLLPGAARHPERGRPPALQRVLLHARPDPADRQPRPGGTVRAQGDLPVDRELHRRGGPDPRPDGRRRGHPCAVPRMTRRTIPRMTPRMTSRMTSWMTLGER